MNNLSQSHHPRQRWMSILARSDAGRLRALLDDQAPLPAHTVVRGPESGLVMVRGKAGGSGGAFNLGEMTVTRCTIRTDTGFIGHAYIAGRDDERARLAALADAMLQDPVRSDAMERHVIAPLERQQSQRKAQRAGKAAATKVQFFAMQTMRT